MQNSYTYDEESRTEYWYGTLEYLSNGTTHSAVVGQEYDYLDYSGESSTGIGELDQLTVLEAGLSRRSTISYEYDAFYRMTGKTLTTPTNWTITTLYTFREVSHTTSMLVSSYASTVEVGSASTVTSYSYTYDVDGNITHIVDGNDKKTSYKYDNLGQLIREDHEILGETYVYTYDNGGNRTSKVTYAYTEDTLGTATATETYTYGNTSWGDQLTEYNGTAISYDAIGNPTTFNGYVLTWHGRQLKEMEKSDSVIKFLYNADGIRTSKEVNNVEHIYTLNGTQIVSEAWGDKLLIYLYDESGSPIGMQYRTSSYDTYEFDTFYFEKNLQGDIIAVYNEDGQKALAYTYDAWGNHTTTWVNRTLENMPAVYNPFRYRGYYYDTETELYYLQSRYYNPAWGRFLNADGLIYTGNGILGFNMYAYCDNNPITKIDPAGYDAMIVVDYDEIPVFGHMYLYVQDEDGKWYRTEIAGSIPKTIENFKKGDFTIVSWCKFDDEVDQAEIDSLRQNKGFLNTLGKFLGLWGVDTEYLEGDYSACVGAARSMEAAVYDYNLLNNNCGTHVRDVMKSRKNISCESLYNCLSFTPIPRNYLWGLRIARILDESAMQPMALASTK